MGTKMWFSNFVTPETRVGPAMEPFSCDFVSSFRAFRELLKDDGHHPSFWQFQFRFGPITLAG